MTRNRRPIGRPNGGAVGGPYSRTAFARASAGVGWCGTLPSSSAWLGGYRGAGGVQPRAEIGPPGSSRGSGRPHRACNPACAEDQCSAFVTAFDRQVVPTAVLATWASRLPLVGAGRTGRPPESSLANKPSTGSCWLMRPTPSTHRRIVRGQPPGAFSTPRPHYRNRVRARAPHSVRPRQCGGSRCGPRRRRRSSEAGSMASLNL